MSWSWHHFHPVSVPTSSYRSRAFFDSGVGLESGKGGLETPKGENFAQMPSVALRRYFLATSLFYTAMSANVAGLGCWRLGAIVTRYVFLESRESTLASCSLFTGFFLFNFEYQVRNHALDGSGGRST
jgi:hypothetical protein